MFTTYPTYDKWRTLTLKDPRQRGEDVYALQTAMANIGIFVGAIDGILGPMTADGIRQAQLSLGILADGKAGGGTQRALAMAIARKTTVFVPLEALQGSMEHESSFRLGMYSPQRSDGSYDAGVTQRNTAHTPPTGGFDVPESITELAANTRKHFDLFSGLEFRRRWALAQGAWNAPAFACYIAREEGARQVTSGMVLKPTTTQRQTFEAYVEAVSKYLVS